MADEVLLGAVFVSTESGIEDGIKAGRRSRGGCWTGHYW